MSSPEIYLPQWGVFKRFSFRYIFVFFALIIFPFPLNVIPGVSKITEPYDKLWEWIVNFFGKNFLGLEQQLGVTMTGSGDKLYDWVWYFSLLMLTLLFGTLWTIIDRKRLQYDKLNRWFLLFLTLYLAYFMFVYGIIKLFYLQFGPPNLERLFQTFGQASPMRLLWTFMGFSESYTMFSGGAETLAGLLLVFRKTRTLGALLAAGVMLNVFMLNMSYDVPVKLFSFQLMIAGLVIASQDFGRLFDFFFRNKSVEAVEFKPLLPGKRGQYILLGVQILLVGFFIINQITGSMSSRKQYGIEREKSALYGVYNVSDFVHNQDTLAPLITDTLRWKRILFDYPRFASVIHMNDKVTRYDTEIDTTAQTITFALRRDTVNKYILEYEKLDSSMTISGVLYEDTIEVKTNQYDLKNFGLLNRGFNWINEVPYNRYNYD